MMVSRGVLLLRERKNAKSPLPLFLVRLLVRSILPLQRRCFFVFNPSGNGKIQTVKFTHTFRARARKPLAHSAINLFPTPQTLR